MDVIFKALNDPARRDMLDTLRKRDGQTLSELETRFDMTRFGVMKHLGVLEDAKLITTKKVGRFKHHYLNALPLQEVIDRWIEPLLAKPAARDLLTLKSQLEGAADMTEKPDFRMETYIRCTQDALWDALTDADAHANFNFMASRVERDGNALVYYTPDGSEMLVCTETQLDPKTRISSTFEPRWETDAKPSRFDYIIAAEGDYCRLTLEHYDLSFPVVEGEGIADGWVRTLAGLKTWLETGESVKYVNWGAENG
ncbi:ArsR/SmtB family transcription factor [Litoreibacter roseus]|uniref:Putative transcriptional regulator, ArsR family protein n=1 Tax=Litoreibacter roseus TaxID=2601869 RepID=A0A6N6JII9_9RHOB|nr:helix-turn-helix domain-containing protein [Litoreibacter roseus]GFE65895.1 putative transcriptional regulator, ArsR family protein [Litoreibacter roseus]